MHSAERVVANYQFPLPTASSSRLSDANGRSHVKSTPLPKLRRGRPVKRPPRLPKTLQACSPFLGLVLSADPNATGSNSHPNKSSTPMPSATSISSGLNRTGSVLLKSSQGAPINAGSSQRSVSPDKSDHRHLKRKRRQSQSSDPEAMSSPPIVPSKSKTTASVDTESEESESESEGELRWLSIAEEPHLRWHRAPGEVDDSDFDGSQNFTAAYTWRPKTSRSTNSSRRSHARPDTFTRMGESQGFVLSRSKPSLARMIVHPCLGNSAQVVLDKNPNGSRGKSQADLDIPLRPPEREPPRAPRQLNFAELAEAVGFDSTWLSSASSEDESRTSDAKTGDGSFGARSNGGTGKERPREKLGRARKSTGLHLAQGGPQQLPPDSVRIQDYAEGSADSSQTHAKSKHSTSSRPTATDRERSGVRPDQKPSRNKKKAQMVFEKPQWMWDALMAKVKSGEVPRNIVSKRLLVDLGEEPAADKDVGKGGSKRKV